MKIDGWKAAEFSRRFIRRIGNHSHQFTYLSASEGINHFINPNVLKINSADCSFIETKNKYAVLNTTKENSLRNVRAFISFEKISNNISDNKLVVIDAKKLSISLLKKIELNNSLYLALLTDPPFYIDTIEKLPGDWKQGLIANSRIRIFLSDEFSLYGKLLKIYASKWQQTLYLLTNDLSLDVLKFNEIVHSLPDNFHLT